VRGAVLGQGWEAGDRGGRDGGEVRDGKGWGGF
jgi:hypothetical protein